MQLYVPPDTMINKDFLKQVFANEKSLLKMSELRAVHVPKFDELSVKYIYPRIKEDPKVHKYFPDRYPDGRVPDRTYTFNVYHTVYPEYVQNMIRHAQKQRNAVTDQTDHADEILISREWQEQLEAVPFISSKLIRY